MAPLPGKLFMYEYETFGNKIKILARVNSDFAAAKHYFAVVKHFAFWSFSLTMARQPFVCGEGALRCGEGARNCQIFPDFSFFVFFLSKTLKNSNQNRGITPKDILKSS